MRFWPNSDLTCPVVWYYVPKDRPFLPLKDGWLWWDTDADPENEGVNQPTGKLTLGEDYLTDPRWTNGRDPLKTVWADGVFQGTPEQWRGLDIPPPKPLGPITAYLPFDCCGHGPPTRGESCLNAFLLGGPVRFNATVGPVVSTDPLWSSIGPRVYTVPWQGPGNPCQWFLPFHPDLGPPVQTGIGVGGSPSNQVLSLIFLANGGAGGLQFRIIAYAPRSPIPAYWNGVDPIVLKKVTTTVYVPSYLWPNLITLSGEL